MRGFWRRVSSVLLFGAVAAACGTALPPGADNGNGQNNTSGGACASPGTPGCPCTSTGETVSCGKVVETAGSYVTCSMGHSTCDGQKWGQCVGHDLVFKSLGATSLTPQGLRFDSLTLQCGDAGADGGAFNPCDPNPGCGVVIGSPTDVDASGVVVTEGGVSLTKPDAAPVVPCTDGGLACNVAYCAGDAGAGTTVSGTVYDPAGNNPLYNVIVYIPNDPTGKLTPFPAGVQCAQCAATTALATSLNAVSATYTDVNGNFTLKNAPFGSNIPIVVQSGKWRREILLTSVTKCGANVVGTPGSCTSPNPTDPTACQLHLPRNQYDGYDYVKADGTTYGRADLPQIALVSGSADPLECILLKAGIDPFEISSYDKDVGTPAVKHHVHFFQSDQAPGASLDPAYGTVQKGSALWLDTSPGTIAPPHYDYYDLVMLPCEGNSLDKESLYAGSKGVTGDPYFNIIKYANAGGRIFTTHFGYTWLQYPGRSPSTGTAYEPGPDNWGGLKGVADWTHSTGTVNTSDPLTATIVSTFPKGAAFQQWLANVGASTVLGQLTLHQARQDLTLAPDPAYAGASQPWMTAPQVGGATPPYDVHFTFNTPFNAATANQCGRVVFSDFHVSASALVGATNTCAAVTDPLGRTTYQGCGFNQQCVCGSPATVANCATPTTGTCNEPCGTNADCADTSYTCDGVLVGGCGPGVSCVTSACTPRACAQNSFGVWACPGGGSFNCDGNSHLCVCKQDSDCPTGALCVNSGQCSGTCTGTGAYDGSRCTTTTTCSASTCQGIDETCTTAATATCPLAGHVCNGASNRCACAKDSDCPTDGKCVNVSSNCPDPTMCTGAVGTKVDTAYCTISANNVCFTNADCGGTTSVETCKTKGTCQSGGAVACSLVTACAGKGCTKNSDCPSNSCTGGTCDCVQDRDCPSGKCVNTGQGCRTCSGSGSHDSAYCSGPTISCSTSADCNQQSPGSTKYSCSKNKCVYSSGGNCTDDLDCPPGDLCVAAGNSSCVGTASCTGTGVPDTGSCQPLNGCSLTASAPCRGLDGNDVETCQTGVNYACPLGGGRVCSFDSLHVCLCSQDGDCASGKCINSINNCPVAGNCTGTGTGDSASCVPLAGGSVCVSSADCTGSGTSTDSIACVRPSSCGAVSCSFQSQCAGKSVCTKGTCVCQDDSDCPSGQCVKSAANNNCINAFGQATGTCSGTGATDGASCQLAGAPVTCSTNAQCGGAETCAAGGAVPTLGQCNKKGCTTGNQATYCTGHEQCSATGGCDICTKSSDCTSLAYQATCVTQSTSSTGVCCSSTTKPPPANPPPSGSSAAPAVNLNDCSLDSHDFPGSCAQAPMTAQEKALEFMFFDITSCVQPDTGPPPPPPPPPLTAQTFPLDFTASCGDAGGPPRWRELDFNASFPSPVNGASISIAAQTGPVGPGGVLGGDAGTSSLVPATPVTIVSNDQTTGSAQVLLDTAGGYQDAGATSGKLSSASPPVVSQNWLHLLVTLTPTSDGTQGPTFVSWSVVYDCPPSE